MEHAARPIFSFYAALGERGWCAGHIVRALAPAPHHHPQHAYARPMGSETDNDPK